MCTSTSWMKPRRARHDMYVFKVLTMYESGPAVWQLVSPIFALVWSIKIAKGIGERTTHTDKFDYAKDGVFDHIEGTAITEHFDETGYVCGSGGIQERLFNKGMIKIVSHGFHAALTIERYRNCFVTLDDKWICRMIIPKGTLYYEGFSDLIVAETMQIDSEVISLKEAESTSIEKLKKLTKELRRWK